MNAIDIHVRRETPEDIDAIDAVTTAAFLNAPHTDHTEQFVVKALRKSKQLTVSLVAVKNEAIVGHVALSPVKLSNGDRHWFGLGPISVMPEYQGKGIGSLLMQRATAELEAMHAAGCVLLGNPKYYSRFGFKSESSLVLADVPPQYFQALVLTGTVPTATVTYHESFNARS